MHRRKSAHLCPSWSKLGHPGDVCGMTALHPKAEVDPRSCYVAKVPISDIIGVTRFDAAPKVSVVRRCLPRLAERREPASSWFPWLSKCARGRTCWRYGGREFSRRHHSPCAFRRRMLRGLERPVCPAEGGIPVAQPVLMTPRSEQRQRQ